MQLHWSAFIKHLIMEQRNLRTGSNCENIPSKDSVKHTQKWSNEAIPILLDLWEESWAAIVGNVKNFHIYQKIAKQLKTNGIAATALSVRYKINDMTRKYRLHKQKYGTRSKWKHYNRVHSIIGECKPFNLNKTTTLESTDLYKPSSENSAEECILPMEIGAETPTEFPLRKRKNGQVDEREFKKRFYQLAEERNTAILKIAGATLRMQEALNSFLLGHKCQNNNS